MGYNESKSQSPINVKLIVKLAVGLVALITATSVGCSSCQTVPAGSRGVVTHFGKVQPGVLDEGLYFVNPIGTKVTTLSVRVQRSDIKTEAASKDLQKVFVLLVLNWNVSPITVNDLFQTVGTEEQIANSVIAPAVAEVMKAATAKMTAEEILTRRIELKTNIDESLAARLKPYGITIRDVSLADLEFTPEFNHAVEAKQIAEQRSKQAEYEATKATIDAHAAVNKSKGEAEASLTKARAEAEANSLKQKTLTEELIRYETIQRWDGHLPSVTSGAIPFIQLPKPESK